jgi:hypothetical protein
MGERAECVMLNKGLCIQQFAPSILRPWKCTRNAPCCEDFMLPAQCPRRLAKKSRVPPSSGCFLVGRLGFQNSLITNGRDAHHSQKCSAGANW